MATKTQSKEVATKQAATPAKADPKTSAVAVYDEDLAAEMAGDSGKGFEEANRDAFAIPFLSILQDLSPQVKKKMAGYIEGAKVGDIYESVSQRLMDTVRFIPCHYSQVFIEWVPRAKGGGFVAAYDPVVGAQKMSTVVKDEGKRVLPNGNELQDTRQHFGLALFDDGALSPALLALKSSGLKVSRRWMAQMQMQQIKVAGRMVVPPMFAFSYLLDKEEEANDQGSWWQWVIRDAQRITDIDVYRRAKAFGATMAAGQVKVDYNEMQRQDTQPASGSDTPRDIDNEM